MTSPYVGTEGLEAGQIGTEPDTREQLRQAKDKVVGQARDTFRNAREQAGRGLSDTRRQAADQIGGIAGAFRRTGEQLRTDQQDRFADLAESVGQGIDHAADYLRRSDGRTISRDLEGLARRQPGLVFAGAFALGLVAARFLRSSDPQRDTEPGQGRFDAPVGGGFDAPARGGFDAPA